MYPVLIISIITIVIMLLCIIKFPKITFKHFSIQTFWLVPLISSIILISFKLLPFNKAIEGLTAHSAINPLKILLLFFSMTFLSIVLDELGFFEYLANKALKKTKNNQLSLFITLYILTAVLTIFTSNDINILTFTPFIIFFSKRANINPIPYLVSEFVSANTWSILLIIGNPTNIYLATASNINFINYFIRMIIPTILAGSTSFIVLWLVFKKELKKPFNKNEEEVKISNKFLLIINIICLFLCTGILVICSYLQIEMYLVASCFATLLLINILVYSIIKKNGSILWKSIKRLPWALLPFVISMFIIVLSLKNVGITDIISNIINNDYPILTYGILSTLSANLVNNIPMSVLFSEIISETNLQAIYATIIGSNIGAFLTPIGALAGIMWLSILKEYKVHYSFLSFVKYGVIVAIPTLIMALLGLWITFII